MTAALGFHRSNSALQNWPTQLFFWPGSEKRRDHCFFNLGFFCCNNSFTLMTLKKFNERFGLATHYEDELEVCLWVVTSNL